MPILSFASCAMTGAVVMANAAIDNANKVFFITVFLPLDDNRQRLSMSGRHHAARMITLFGVWFFSLFCGLQFTVGGEGGAELGGRHSLLFEEVPVEIRNVGKADLEADLRHLHLRLS